MNVIESFLYMIPDHTIEELLISLILCAVLAGFAYKFDILDFICFELDLKKYKTNIILIIFFISKIFNEDKK